MNPVRPDTLNETNSLLLNLKALLLFLYDIKSRFTILIHYIYFKTMQCADILYQYYWYHLWSLKAHNKREDKKGNREGVQVTHECSAPPRC